MIIEDKSDYGGGTGTAISNEQINNSVREVNGSEGTDSGEGSLPHGKT
jgi:hypothetical protein